MASKEFDQKFQVITKEMLEVVYEFAGSNSHEIDTIFVIGSTEDGNEINFFYKIANAIVPKHSINDHLNRKVDVSKEAQFQVLRQLNDLLVTLASEFQNDGRQVPTLIKLIYRPVSRKFDSELSYEPILGKDDSGSFYDLYSQWLKEEKEKIA